jgi:hypothetical protein
VTRCKLLSNHRGRPYADGHSIHPRQAAVKLFFVSGMAYIKYLKFNMYYRPAYMR